MKTLINSAFLLVCILFFSACEKNKSNLPVDFELSFDLNDEEIQGGAVEIDEVSLMIQSIDVNGTREQGDNVFLSRNFPEGKSFVFDTNLASEKIDVPEGIYNPLLFSLNFKKDNEESDLIEELNDWIVDVNEQNEDLEDLQEELGGIIEEYLEDIHPCILVKGKFMEGNTVKKVVIVVNDPLVFQLFSRNEDGGQRLSLERGRSYTGNITLDPSYWFEVITPSMLNQAFIGKIDDEAYILLSKKVNPEIYNAIFTRMEESTLIKIN